MLSAQVSDYPDSVPRLITRQAFETKGSVSEYGI